MTSLQNGSSTRSMPRPAWRRVDLFFCSFYTMIACAATCQYLCVSTAFIGLQSLDDILAVINGDIDIPTAGACQKRLAKHGTEALRDCTINMLWHSLSLDTAKLLRTLQHSTSFVDTWERYMVKRHWRSLVEAIYRQKGSIVLCILYLTWYMITDACALYQLGCNKSEKEIAAEVSRLTKVGARLDALSMGHTCHDLPWNAMQ